MKFFRGYERAGKSVARFRRFLPNSLTVKSIYRIAANAAPEALSFAAVAF
jgi:hypothetical protein